MNDRETLLYLLIAMQNAYSVAASSAQNTSSYEEAVSQSVLFVEEWKQDQVDMMNRNLLRGDSRMAEKYRLDTVAANRVLEYLKSAKS